MKILAYQNSDRQFYFWRTTQQQEMDYIEEEAEQGLDVWEFKWSERKARLPLTFKKSYNVRSFDQVNRNNFENFILKI